MMLLNLDYPALADEESIVKSTTGTEGEAPDKVLGPEALLAFQELVRRVPVADLWVQEAVRIVRQTRPTDASANADIKAYVSFGAGPRAGQHLVLAAKARALLSGRLAVSKEDIHALAAPVLRHRLLLNFHAEAQKINADHLIGDIVGKR